MTLLLTYHIFLVLYYITKLFLYKETSNQHSVNMHKEILLNTTNRISIAILPLSSSKVMVIVWRLRGEIIRTVLYIANVLPLQWAQSTKTVHTARLGLELVFLFFRLHDLSLCWCIFCFTLDS